MPYLSWERYAELGGSAYDAEGFPAAESRAESYIDAWTLGRARIDGKREPFADEVARATFAVVESLPGIDAAEESAAGGVSSFSNGTDTVSFTAPTEGATVAEVLAKRRALAALPVELVSACAAYNR